MKKYSNWLIFLLLVSIGSAHDVPHQSAKGIVFEDSNNNGVLDAEEQGIPGVLVSNGEQVVKTREGGEYTLPVGHDTIVFVIQPKGWDVPVNEHFLPQFYYVHKPGGSPTNLKFPGVAPTGELPESIDFPLYRSKTNEEFSIFAFGDPQPTTIEDVGFFRRDIVEEARHMKGPIAGVSLGDLTNDDLSLFEPMNAVTALMEMPWWNVYGNHDMNQDVKDPEMADETWESVYGPASYAFQIGDVTFISLDNVIYPNHHTDSHYIGGFTKRQLTFVGNLLAHVPETNLVVTMVHIPLFAEDGETFLVKDREAFFKLFKNHKYTLSLSAHTHRQNKHDFTHEHDHWPHIDAPHHHYNVGTTSGSWWGGPKDDRGIPITTMSDGVPNGWAVLNFNGNSYTYDYYVANGSKDEVMSIYSPKAVVRSSGWSNAVLGVNFYLGDKKTKVEYRVNEGRWKKALHTLSVDPNYTRDRLNSDLNETPEHKGILPFPRLSTHQWYGKLPIHLEAGTQVVDIKVTDRFGRIYEEQVSYEIIELE